MDFPTTARVMSEASLHSISMASQIPNRGSHPAMSDRSRHVSHVVHQTQAQTQSSGDMGDIVVEGSSLVLCPITFTLHELHKLWVL